MKLERDGRLPRGLEQLPRSGPVADLVRQRRSTTLAPPEAIKLKESRTAASDVPAVKAPTARSEA